MIAESQIDKPVICQFGPGRDMVGGMDSAISAIVNDPKLCGKYRFERIASASRQNKLATFCGAIFKFTSLVKTSGVAIAHIHMSERGSCYRAALLIRIARKLGVKTVVTSHGSEIEVFEERIKGRLAGRFVNNSLALCDAMIALTSGWASWWKSQLPSLRLEVIPNSVDIPPCLPLKAERSDQSLNVLFLGEIGRRKGVFDLVEALKICNTEGFRITLVIAGDGDVDALDTVIDHFCARDNVSFAGWVTGGKKEELFAECDVLALPSYYESFGIVLLEAFAHRLPVLCGNGGHMSEVVSDGVDGFVVESGDAHSIADALQRFAGDRKLVRAMGDAGYEKVCALYSRETVSKKLGELYESLLEEE